MKIDSGVVVGIIALILIIVAAVASALVYGRSEFRRNVLELQEKAEDSQKTINEALQTELALRDRAIERLQETNKGQASEIRALQLVVAQGTKVEDLIGSVETLRTDILARLPIP